MVKKRINKIIPIKMKSTDLFGDWEEQKCRLKQKFAVLTHTDLLFEKDRKEEMIEKLRLHLGKTKEEMSKIIEAL